MTESPDRACDRCRQRRVKCDKRHPACFRCEKLKQPCPGYDKKRKFVDEGVTLRKKYQTDHSGLGPSANSPDTVPTAGAPADSAVVPSPNRPTISSLLQDTNSSPPGLGSIASFQSRPENERVLQLRQTVLPAPGPNQVTPSDSSSTYPEIKVDPDLLNLDDTALETQYDPDWFNLEPESFYGKNNNSCGFIPNLPNIVDEVDKSHLPLGADAASTPLSGLASLSYGSDSILWAPESQLQTSHIISDEREHEMAYLIRHFTESIGPWMDLFDCEKHFGQLVPLKAVGDVLLKNAIAAVAAKQLGRVKGSKPFMGLQFQKPAAMELIENDNQIDWFYKAANYYDKAIMYSRVYLQLLSGSLSNPPTPSISASLPTMSSDDLLLAVSIFSLYESLDNVEAGWLQHLTGLKSLLSVVSDANSSSNAVSTLTVGRRASFWNFARADYQASYINGTPTLLDTEDLAMWQSSGLQLQPDGSLYTAPDELKNDSGSSCATVELVAHTVLWIVLRTMNYLVASQQHLTDLSARQVLWEELNYQLDTWHTCLPAAFQPCAKLRHPFRPRGLIVPNASSGPRIDELFFSIPLCAATMQLYHFAHIILLLNKPPTEAQQTASRLVAYREVSAQALQHAYEIVGIALARPHPAVRVEMLMPLHVAGSCLEVDEERRLVVDLLRAISKDTGCETEGRVRELMKEWGWKYDVGDQFAGMRMN